MARRRLGSGIAGMTIALGFAQPTAAKKKKPKKKKGKPTPACKAPKVACGAACCAPGEPCIDGKCGCGAGKVRCDLGVSGTACVPGSCCPGEFCMGDTCCPPDLVCSLTRDTTLACLCATRPDRCPGACCRDGEACYDGECEACRPEPPRQDENGLPVLRYCGAQCFCITSVENHAACVGGFSTGDLPCHDCATDAECMALLQQAALCVQGKSSPDCPSGRVCIAATCPHT